MLQIVRSFPELALGVLNLEKYLGTIRVPEMKVEIRASTSTFEVRDLLKDRFGVGRHTQLKESSDQLETVLRDQRVEQIDTEHLRGIEMMKVPVKLDL